jgi:hypothetical protein
MSKLLIGLVSLAVFGAAYGQAPVRVRGTITALNGDVLGVKTREGRKIELKLTPDAAVVTTKKVPAAEFKQGSYVGVTSVKRADGKLVAKRVHALGPQVPQMNGPWDSIPHSTMTNATIESTAKVSGGNELTLKYKDGEQKIITNAGTQYFNFDPGSRADLKPGETIFSVARVGDDGKLLTGRVAVSKNGVKPPQ